MNVPNVYDLGEAGAYPSDVPFKSSDLGWVLCLNRNIKLGL